MNTKWINLSNMGIPKNIFRDHFKTTSQIISQQAIICLKWTKIIADTLNEQNAQKNKKLNFEISVIKIF